MDWWLLSGHFAAGTKRSTIVVCSLCVLTGCADWLPQAQQDNVSFEARSLIPPEPEPEPTIQPFVCPATLPPPAHAMGTLDVANPPAAVTATLKDSPDPPIAFTQYDLLTGLRYSYGAAVADFDCDNLTDISFFDSYTLTRRLINPAQGAIGYMQWNSGLLQKIVEADSYPEIPDRPGNVILFERHISLDVNGDKLPDIVGVVNSHAAVVAYINPGNRLARWERRYISTATPAPINIAAGDFDGDGLQDLVVGMRDQPTTDPDPAIRGVVWLRNPGTPNGTWEQRPVEGSETLVDVRTLKAADFDNDGRTDIVASDSVHGKLAWFRNRSTFWERNDILGPLTIHGHFGTVADVDGDGRMDIIQPTYQGIRLVRNVDGGTTWNVIPLANFALEPVQIVLSEVDIGDLDLDGKTDLVFTVSANVSSATGRQRGGLYWLRQTATSWDVHEIYFEDSSAVGLRLVDYDRDGDLDIMMLSEYQRSGVSLFVNQR
jgi:FG-GAP-like repeat